MARPIIPATTPGARRRRARSNGSARHRPGGMGRPFCSAWPGESTERNCSRNWGWGRNKSWPLRTVFAPRTSRKHSSRNGRTRDNFRGFRRRSRQQVMDRRLARATPFQELLRAAIGIASTICCSGSAGGRRGSSQGPKTRRARGIRRRGASHEINNPLGGSSPAKASICSKGNWRRGKRKAARIDHPPDSKPHSCHLLVELMQFARPPADQSPAPGPLSRLLRPRWKNFIRSPAMPGFVWIAFRRRRTCGSRATCTSCRRRLAAWSATPSRQRPATRAGPGSARRSRRAGSKSSSRTAARV